MRANLYISQYALDGASQIRGFGADHAELRVRCNLPGWLEKMEFWVKAKHRGDALERRDRDYGTRMVICDNDRLVLHGYVYAVDVDGLHVRYECVGPWRRHSNEFYVGPIDPTDDIATVLYDIIDTNVPAMHISTDNLDANTTEAKDLFRDEIESGLGILPVDAVAAILTMRGPLSGDAYPLYDYYCLPRELVNGLPVLDTAYYQVRDKTRDFADWYVAGKDLLTEDGGEHSHIYDYQSTVRVAYGKVQGEATGGGANYMIDTTKDFLALGVRPQDLITKLNGNLSAWIAAINTTTNPNDTLAVVGISWAGDDEYSITLETAAYQTASAAGTAYTDLWSSSAAPFEFLELNSEQAAQLAGELAADLSNPILQQPFTIGSGQIRDVNGAYWPVWALLRRPSYLRVTDRDFSSNAYNIDLINRIGLYTTALDYSHTDRTMTVTPTQPSDRLDVRLQRAGIIPGQGIEPVHRGTSDALFRWGPEANWFAGYYTTRQQYEWVLSQRNYGGPIAHPYYGSGYRGSPYYNPDHWRDRDSGTPWFPDRRG